MNPSFTLSDLKRILIEGSGATPALETEVENASFDDLGYDSLALLETVNRVEREFDVSIDDSALAETPTPGSFVAMVNQRLAGRESA